MKAEAYVLHGSGKRKFKAFLCRIGINLHRVADSIFFYSRYRDLLYDGVAAAKVIHNQSCGVAAVGEIGVKGVCGACICYAIVVKVPGIGASIA